MAHLAPAARNATILFLLAGLMVPAGALADGPDLPAVPPTESVRSVTFVPASRSADVAATPTTVVLGIDLALPDGTGIPTSAAGALYDRVVIGAPTGISFDITSVRVEGATLENRTAATIDPDCTFASLFDYPGFATRGATTSASAYYLCGGNGAFTLQLSNPVRSPDMMVEIVLSNFRAPTLAANYNFSLSFLFTASGADSALGMTAAIPPVPLVNAQTDAFVVVPGALTSVRYTSTTAVIPADANFTFVARSFDQFDNVRNDTVAHAKLSGPGSLGAAGLYLPQQTGMVSIRANVGSSVSPPHFFNVTLGALHHINFTTAPAITNADTPVTFVAQARDIRENVRSDAITFSVSSGSGSIDAAGLYTPSAVGISTIRATNGSVFTTSAINVTAGALDHVSWTAGSNTTTADQVVAFRAIARDAKGNDRADAISYSVISGPGSINATGDYTPSTVGTATLRASAGARSVTRTLGIAVGPLHHFHVSCDSPVATASVSNCFAEARDLRENVRTDVPDAWSASAGTITPSGTTASWMAPSTTGVRNISARLNAVSGNTTVLVVAGGVETLTLDTSISNVTSVNADNRSFKVYATLRDRALNPVVDGTLVQWTLVDPAPVNSGAGILSSASSPTSNGVAEVTVTTSTLPGDDYRVTASYVGPDFTISQSSGRYVVRPGALDHFTISGTPTSATAGTPFTGTVTVTAFDAANNRKTDLTGAVNFSSTAARRSLPANATFTVGDQGQKMFAGSLFQLDSAGTQTVSVRLASNLSLVSASAPISVAPGALDHISFLAAPNTTAADTNATFRAVAKDVFENDRADAISYTIQSGFGSIGAATGVFTPDKVGSTIVRAASGAASPAQSTIVVTVGALHHVTYLAAPTTITSDALADFDAQARDVRDNVRNETITFSVANGSGAINATSGVYSPNFAGTITIKANASSLVNATTTLIVTPGVVDHIAFTQAPTSTNADTIAAFRASAFDARNNTVAGSISYDVANGTGTVNAAGNFTPNLAGISTVRATAGARNATATIVVTPGALHHITYVNFTDTTNADTSVLFRAEPRDQNQNVRNDTIVYAIQSGSGTIAANGTFSPDKTGTTVVNASVGALVAPRNIIVTPGAPVRALITSSPATSVVAGTSFGAVAKVYDARDNLVSAATNTVSLALIGSISPAGAVLSGTTSAAAIDGVATFSDLSLNKIGANAIRASFAGSQLAPAVNVTIVTAAPHHLGVTCAGCVAVANASVMLNVTALDAFENNVTAYSGAKTVTFAGPLAALTGEAPTCGGAAMGASVSLTFTAGIAQVSCKFYRAGTSQTLAATSGALNTTLPLALTIRAAPVASYQVDAPASAVAGISGTLTIRALDAFRNLADAGPNDHHGQKTLVILGAAAAPDGTQPTVAAVGGAVPLGANATIDFVHGRADVSITLYAKAAQVNLTVGEPSTTRTGLSGNFSVVPGAATQVGILNCDPRTGNRTCILASEAVTAPLSLRVGTQASFYAAAFDAYDNLIDRQGAAWVGDGAATGLVANAEGVTWTFNTAGNASIRIAAGALGTRVLAIEVVP